MTQLVLPNVNLIAAVGHRGQLGLNGRLPWHDREDLEWFKFITQGDAVLFGHRTLEAMPALLDLPGREVFVDVTELDPAWVYQAARQESGCKTLWIAGGAKTYARWAPYCRRHLITKVDYDGPADAWMPDCLWQDGPE